MFSALERSRSRRKRSEKRSLGLAKKTLLGTLESRFRQVMRSEAGLQGAEEDVGGGALGTRVKTCFREFGCGKEAK